MANWKTNAFPIPLMNFRGSDGNEESGGGNAYGGNGNDGQEDGYGGSEMPTPLATPEPSKAFTTKPSQKPAYMPANTVALHAPTGYPTEEPERGHGHGHGGKDTHIYGSVIL